MHQSRCEFRQSSRIASIALQIRNSVTSNPLRDVTSEVMLNMHESEVNVGSVCDVRGHAEYAWGKNSEYAWGGDVIDAIR